MIENWFYSLLLTVICKGESLKNNFALFFFGNIRFTYGIGHMFCFVTFCREAMCNIYSLGIWYSVFMFDTQNCGIVPLAAEGFNGTFMFFMERGFQKNIVSYPLKWTSRIFV